MHYAGDAVVQLAYIRLDALSNLGDLGESRRCGRELIARNAGILGIDNASTAIRPGPDSSYLTACYHLPRFQQSRCGLEIRRHQSEIVLIIYSFSYQLIQNGDAKAGGMWSER